MASFVPPAPPGVEDSMLQFDWSLVEDRTIAAIYGEHHAGHGWWSIAICVGDRAVILRVDEDTDQIIVTYEFQPQPGEVWKPIAYFDDWIGKRLSWCWVSRNSQGYLDMFTISLSDIDPAFAFVAAASSLTCRKLAWFPVTE